MLRLVRQMSDSPSLMFINADGKVYRSHPFNAFIEPSLWTAYQYSLGINNISCAFSVGDNVYIMKDSLLYWYRSQKSSVEIAFGGEEDEGFLEVLFSEDGKYFCTPGLY